MFRIVVKPASSNVRPALMDHHALPAKVIELINHHAFAILGIMMIVRRHYARPALLSV